jgi:hypothetical protein
MTKTQTAALAYITARGFMLLNQQGLRALPNAAKALAAKGIVEITEVNFFGQMVPAYTLPA